MRGISLVALGVLALAARDGLAQQPSRIGVSSAIVNQVNGRVANVANSLTAGDAVFQNEQIGVGQASKAQFLFTDQTSLTLGEGAELTLDEIVYNPDRSLRRLSVDLTKGAMRFVGGTDGKDTDYEIKTPTTTIGIRGTIVDVAVTPTSTDVVLREGAALISSGGTSVRLDKPGLAVSVIGRNAAPSQPGPPRPGVLAAVATVANPTTLSTPQPSIFSNITPSATDAAQLTTSQPPVFNNRDVATDFTNDPFRAQTLQSFLNSQTSSSTGCPSGNFGSNGSGSARGMFGSNGSGSGRTSSGPCGLFGANGSGSGH